MKYSVAVLVLTLLAVTVLSMAKTANAQVTCQTIVQNYTGTLERSCPSGYIAVIASCNTGVSTVLIDQSAPLLPGTSSRVWYLIPTASAATGVHCSAAALVTSQLQLRCCR